MIENTLYQIFKVSTLTLSDIVKFELYIQSCICQLPQITDDEIRGG